MADKKRILIIGPTPPPHHGVSMVIRELLHSEVNERFHLLHLELADRRGIQHVDCPDLHDLLLFIRQYLRLIERVVRHPPGVVYLPISQTTLGFVRDSLFLWPAILLRSRIVLHLHGGNFRAWYGGRPFLLKAYVRFLLGRTARVVVLGGSLRDLFSGLVPEKRIVVVPNGVPTCDQERPFRPMAAGRDRYRLLHLGTLSGLKGIFVLLKAVSLVLRKRSDVEFILAGGWLRDRERDEARELIQKEGLQEHVSWVGHVEGKEKTALYRSSDLFIFPGIQQEGQPLVVLEAMAAGLPVLFTDRGCLRETVVDGESGLEISLNDPEDLSKKILILLESPDKMRWMGREARRRYRENYTVDHFKKKMLDLFDEVAREGRRGEK